MKGVVDVTHRIDTVTESGLPVVRASGELDVVAAPELREALSAMPADGQVNVIVDLGRATFVDSSVLGILVGALRRAKDRQGDLWVACASPPVLTVLRVTNLDRVMQVRPTVADVVAEIPMAAESRP